MGSVMRVKGGLILLLYRHYFVTLVHNKFELQASSKNRMTVS